MAIVGLLWSDCSLARQNFPYQVGSALARSQHLCARLTSAIYSLHGSRPLPSLSLTMHHPPTSPDPAVHSPAVLELIELQVTDKLTSALSLSLSFSRPPLTHCTADYVADTTINAVDTALGYQSTAWNRATSGSRRVPFNRFVWDVIRRASVKMPVLLTTLVYITRARSHLHIETEDWACERVFLGALMVASKVCFHLSLTSATVLTSLPAVYQRFHTTKCSLGSRHRCLWQTRREPDRTRVPRCPCLETRPHPKGHPRPLQYHRQPLHPPKATL